MQLRSVVLLIFSFVKHFFQCMNWVWCHCSSILSYLGGLPHAKVNFFNILKESTKLKVIISWFVETWGST